MSVYVNPVYAYARPPDHDGPPRRWPVVVAGAGPVGLCAAIDLAQRGVDVLLLDEDDTVSSGSRAICWSKRTLEILDRLGCGQRVGERGVDWQAGRVFFGERELFHFDLQPDRGHRRPAFVNLQQYWVEQFLIERLHELRAQVRWRHRVIGVDVRSDGVALRVETPDGPYRIDADWLVVADGAHSPIRALLGLENEGQAFRDRFLITDIRMRSDFPAERWFWFDPPFHPRQSALLHRQADDVWRVDLQLGWDADPELERRPERIRPRIQAMLGPGVEFEIEWASVYTFQCRRMRSFRHGRALFAGDAAHLVSPFGARGANGGIQDADNLAWKLACVIEGLAPHALLDTYDDERRQAADENIRHSTRATDFITPKSAVSRLFRDAVLELARRHAFARRLVNSGRLSTPAVLTDSPLSTPDTVAFIGAMPLGAAALDAPVVARDRELRWLLDGFGPGFTLLAFGAAVPAEAVAALASARPSCRTLQLGGRRVAGAVAADDAEGLAAQRYDGRPGSCFLFRPDRHLCARWRRFELGAVQAALARATLSTVAAAEWAAA